LRHPRRLPALLYVLSAIALPLLAPTLPADEPDFVDPAPATSIPDVVETAPQPAPKRRARSIELDAPVTNTILERFDRAVDRQIESQSDLVQDDAIDTLDDVALADLVEEPAPSFKLLGAEVPAATATRLAWQPAESFAGIAVATPVLVVNGATEGPVICITAAVHGDELNGIEMVRRVLYELDPQQLRGTVIGVPIVNLLGFKRGSRYLPDRRDLNRHFPGNPRGSSASRIAHSFFTEIIAHCDVLLDLHTGSFYRSNLPQLRADLRRPEVVRIAESFTATAIVHSPGASGSLRRAAVESGIPCVTLEAGEPMRLQAEEVDHGVRGIFSLMDQLGMYRKLRVWGNPVPVHYQSRWVRSDSGGILFGQVELGQRIRKGDLLGSVTDPITNVRADIISPHEGRLIGMAVDQVVLPGFAAFHIGIETRADDLYEPQPPEFENGHDLPAPTPETNGYDPEARDRVEDS
jgi:uncharacterized protein